MPEGRTAWSAVNVRVDGPKNGREIVAASPFGNKALLRGIGLRGRLSGPGEQALRAQPALRIDTA